jgi:signal transduction histidine kinase
VAAGLRELRFSNGADVPPALFDRTRVLQIVECLVDNAVKFCPPGSMIHVRVDPEPDGVRVDVADDGPGIPEERVSFIWEPFRQGDGSATREHGGIGVGLSFARELAVRMGGTLEVATEPGAGTVFSLRLPTG